VLFCFAQVEYPLTATEKMESLIRLQLLSMSTWQLFKWYFTASLTRIPAIILLMLALFYSSSALED
jgi:hypothetical protein